MDVRTYMKTKGRPASETMAKRAGTSYNYLIQLAGGHRKPSHKLAKRIEAATRGVISRHDLRPDIFGKAA